jgi:glycerol-3-phosphate acyltransferase PlsY
VFLDILWRTVVCVAAGYLVGGVPFGVIFGRGVHGVDIQTLGSGGTGATNVYRNLGWKTGLTVALLDIAKGAVAVGAARLVAPAAWSQNGSDLLAIAAGLAAMAGHVFSPFLRFRGGKGISVAGGATAVIMPWASLVLLTVFTGTALTLRIVSVGSILAAVIFPVAVAVLYPGRPVLLAFAAVALPFVLWAHRGNIRRLLRGEEPRITIGRRKGTANERDDGGDRG